MNGYTIESVSEEGSYYLVNHWEKHKHFWVEKSKLKPSMLFKREQDAKTSLKKLLKSMPEYADDAFALIKVEDGKMYEGNKLSILPEKNVLDAIDTVCLHCVEDTLNDESICSSCPVRKLAASITK